VNTGITFDAIQKEMKMNSARSAPSESRIDFENEALRFAAKTSVEQVEEGNALAPKFDRESLIACVTTDAHARLHE